MIALTMLLATYATAAGCTGLSDTYTCAGTGLETAVLAADVVFLLVPLLVLLYMHRRHSRQQKAASTGPTVSALSTERVDNLCALFPEMDRGTVQRALTECNGHAGRARTKLQAMQAPADVEFNNPMHNNEDQDQEQSEGALCSLHSTSQEIVTRLALHCTDEAQQRARLRAELLRAAQDD
jgi:hypothetical protein